MIICKLQCQYRLAESVAMSLCHCVVGRPFGAVQRFLHTKPLARQLGLPAYILTKAAQLVLSQ